MLGLATWKFLPGLSFKVLKASLGVSSDLHIQSSCFDSAGLQSQLESLEVTLAINVYVQQAINQKLAKRK